MSPDPWASALGNPSAVLTFLLTTQPVQTIPPCGQVLCQGWGTASDKRSYNECQALAHLTPVSD